MQFNEIVKQCKYFAVKASYYLDSNLERLYSYLIPGYLKLKGHMQEKQKVTLYLSMDLHRQLKIRSAIDLDSMSDLAEKAISFYLSHAEVVETAGIGHVHQVFNCPECSQAVVFKDGDLLAIGGHSSLVEDGRRESETQVDRDRISQDEQLVPC